MRIPEDTIEKIRNSIDIVDVVSEYVQLKKQGRNYFGLCPFHGEKTPSFSVAAEKQIFYCFGCQTGGNAFSFLMEIEGYTFLEAVKHLGDKANISLPGLEVSKESGEQSRDRSLIINAHELLTTFYHYCLTKTNTGERGLDYLRERGFADETIKTFQLGYAPDSWDLTTNFLSKRNFPVDMMQSSGILSKREFDGKFFDRFRDRVMFPISDHHGKTVAFGGRVLDKGEPKYLNSPESNIFNKGKLLYGFHLARSVIRSKKQAILFEGYVDVIKAYQAGIKNVVASLGTSLTEQQAQLFRRNAETAVICYDSDRAGVDAAFRAADILEKAGCYVKIATMPQGLDPDDYIQANGGERFRTDVIGASLTVPAFKMQYYRKGKNLQDEGDRLRYIEEVLQVISHLSKAVERDHYLRQLSEEFSLSLDALKQQQYQIYKQLQKKRNNSSRNRNNKAEYRNFLQKGLPPGYETAERHLLAHMMNSVEITEKVQEEIGGSFTVEEYNAIAAYLYAFYSEGNKPDISHFMQRLTDQKLIRAASGIAMLSVNEDVTQQELSDYIKQVLLYPKRLQVGEKEKQKQEAERREDFVSAASIEQEIQDIKKEIKGIKSSSY
jgi:DNA primase